LLLNNCGRCGRVRQYGESLLRIYYGDAEACHFEPHPTTRAACGGTCQKSRFPTLGKPGISLLRGSPPLVICAPASRCPPSYNQGSGAPHAPPTNPQRAVAHPHRLGAWGDPGASSGPRRGVPIVSSIINTSISLCIHPYLSSTHSLAPKPTPLCRSLSGRIVAIQQSWGTLTSGFLTPPSSPGAAGGGECPPVALRVVFPELRIVCRSAVTRRGILLALHRDMPP